MMISYGEDGGRGRLLVRDGEMTVTADGDGRSRAFDALTRLIEEARTVQEEILDHMRYGASPEPEEGA